MNIAFDILQNLLNAVPRSILILDSRGKIIISNKTVCKFIGLSASDMQGIYISNIQNLTSNNSFGSMFKKLNKVSFIYFKGEYKKNDGKVLNIEYNANRLKLKNKNYILLIIIDRTTDIKLQKDLLHRVGLEKLVFFATKALNKTQYIDDAIIDLLSRLGDFSKVDRSYIFKYNPEDNTFSNTHEWCNKGTKSFINQLQKIPIHTEYPWLYRKLKKCIPIKINNTDLLPADAVSFQEEMYRENIFSILITPIYHNKKLFGFMGFDKTNSYKIWHPGDIELLQTMSQLIAEVYMQKEQFQQEENYKRSLESMLVRTLESISIMISEKDFYTSQHQKQVAILAEAIAKKMRLPLQQIIGIYFGSLVHDIGKISIPSEILNAPRKLSLEEYAIIKTHPDAGYQIIKNVPFIWPIANIILQHHERLNGSGYPKGLKGNKISLEAKIVAVADVYESMTSHRPYRPRRTKKEAIRELTQNAGILYDKNIVKHCLEIVNNKSFNFKKDPFNKYFFNKTLD